MSSRVVYRKPLRNRSEMLMKATQLTKKKNSRPKPPWDSTVKDLSVFKPSPQELDRNRELHKPKKDHERLIYRINAARYLSNGDIDDESTPNIMERKRALIKEVFHNQEKELRAVLRETDRTLSNVKDIFGDDAAQKFQGKPLITKAPQHVEYAESFLSQIDSQKQSHYDKLSESVVRYPELNAISTDEEYNSSTDDDIHESTQRQSFESKLNLNRFTNLLSTRSEADEEYTQNNGDMVNSLSKWSRDFQNLQGDARTQEHRSNPKDTDTFRDTDATTDLRRLNVSEEESNKSNSKNSGTNRTKQVASSLQTFEDLKTMLDTLENEIDEYEKECGRENSFEKYTVSSTLTGYTSSLLSAVIRITRHLKESEVQLRAEMSMRKEILDAFEEQRGLVDALTADLLKTQEENETLKEELEHQKKYSQTQYANLKMDIVKLEKQFEELKKNMQSAPNDQYSVIRQNSLERTNIQPNGMFHKQAVVRGSSISKQADCSNGGENQFSRLHWVQPFSDLTNSSQPNK